MPLGCVTQAVESAVGLASRILSCHASNLQCGLGRVFLLPGLNFLQNGGGGGSKGPLGVFSNLRF